MYMLQKIITQVNGHLEYLFSHCGLEYQTNFIYKNYDAIY